jgi:hypothetical protein
MWKNGTGAISKIYSGSVVWQHGEQQFMPEMHILVRRVSRSLENWFKHSWYSLAPILELHIEANVG